MCCSAQTVQWLAQDWMTRLRYPAFSHVIISKKHIPEVKQLVAGPLNGPFRSGIELYRLRD